MERRIRGAEFQNETFCDLTAAASVAYALKKTAEDEEVVPKGWEAFASLMKQGISAWEAADLPLKFGSSQPDYYPDVLEYIDDVEAIRWASYYRHLKDKQNYYTWSTLQMGVVLATMVKGPLSQMLKHKLPGNQINNIYKTVKFISGWGASPEEVRTECKGVFRARNQVPGESFYNYSCDLLFLAELCWPDPEFSTEEVEKKVIKRFIEGLETKYQHVSAHMLGDLSRGMFINIDSVLAYARDSCKLYAKAPNHNDRQARLR